MKKKISGLEDQSLAEKPWQHQGEVTSRQRPLNSLLEATLDFKQANTQKHRPSPATPATRATRPALRIVATYCDRCQGRSITPTLTRIP